MSWVALMKGKTSWTLADEWRPRMMVQRWCRRAVLMCFGYIILPLVLF